MIASSELDELKEYATDCRAGYWALKYYTLTHRILSLDWRWQVRKELIMRDYSSMRNYIKDYMRNM